MTSRIGGFYRLIDYCNRLVDVRARGLIFGWGFSGIRAEEVLVSRCWFFRGGYRSSVVSVFWGGFLESRFRVYVFLGFSG